VVQCRVGAHTQFQTPIDPSGVNRQIREIAAAGMVATDKLHIRYWYNSQRKYYFLVLAFLLLLLSALSSPYAKYEFKERERKINPTLRFVPFGASFPFPFASAFAGDFFSLGLTVKNPSKRPCCLLLRNFVSFSAPFRTRSSLDEHERIFRCVGG
jgi:hypothetical protein